MQGLLHLLLMLFVAFAHVPYSEMNCSQFATVGRQHYTAAQLWQVPKGYEQVSTPKPGDIAVFHSAHVATVTPLGLVDSVPERGTGFAGTANAMDPWYHGEVKFLRYKGVA